MSLKFLGISLLFSVGLAAKPLQFAQISNSPDQVVGAEILKVVYQKANIPIKNISMSGKRALVESSQGRLDGEVHRILEIGSLYPDLVRVPTATNYIDVTIFSKNPKFILTDCQSLKGQLIGRARGVKYAEMCTLGMEKVAVFPDSSSLMKSLDRNIVDFAITSGLNGLVQVKNLKLNQVVALEPILEKRLLFHYVHKKHQSLVPQLDAILQNMQQSGELERLRQSIIEDLLSQ
ncbi:hypothetical protein [Paraglaciecola aestuariivivens]